MEEGISRLGDGFVFVCGSHGDVGEKDGCFAIAVEDVDVANSEAKGYISQLDVLHLFVVHEWVDFEVFFAAFGEFCFFGVGVLIVIVEPCHDGGDAIDVSGGVEGVFYKEISRGGGWCWCRRVRCSCR